jgi:hypothetical protein
MSHETTALFVAWKNCPDLTRFDEALVDFHGSASWIGEYDIYAFPFKALDKQVGTFYGSGD